MMKLYKERLLSDAQLKRLGEHQYSCQSVSILDKLLQPYWNWLTSKVPIWLAPNLITILGLIVNIVTALILIWFSPDAKQEAPRWACGLCGFGLFVYQSLDAIDGKQARRTGTANPLGELFDHGCDSISTVFVALSACIAVQLGYYPGWMFFQCFCAMTLFYCAHWQTYVSGTLRFGRIDVTEAQYTIMGILLLSTIFGPSVWSTKIPGLDMEVKLIPIGVACAVALLLAQANVSIIFTGGVGKNGSTVAGTSVLSPVIPFSMVLVPAFIIYQKSTQHVYEEHPALYILAFGLVAAKVTNRLVVAHMTKSEMDYMDWSLLGPTMLFLNQYFNTFIKEYYILWLCMIWVIVDLLRYCYQICQEICDFLHVELFRIPYPGGPQRVVTLPSEKNGKSEKKIHLSDGEDVVPLLQSEENS
ncbi:choline/ethanolaminephosphotransferase 1 isoform X4 [Tribolium castaneum]|uniref:choline/ethanolaminephosphotransferase 1 isoform X4 n=1 Tax=Tribolium castaneum TaxID=7070 RepID=UPI0000D55E94|nr:PREDICTED: choline/ethanolaminephosphotransferase 1 isoform X4 [Tribolium castaneum]|eukprot:XP_008192559.1 PREDICTED: choline/ethanolaminephosphotransferase 1 isoform X4 [Tribolium castaneum]